MTQCGAQLMTLIVWFRSQIPRKEKVPGGGDMRWDIFEVTSGLLELGPNNHGLHLRISHSEKPG